MKNKYTLASIIAISITSLSLPVLASNCQLAFDERSGGAKLFSNKEQAFYLNRIQDGRYGDIEEIYDAISCKRISSGNASKSNFFSVMARNGFEEASLSRLSAGRVNRDFSMYMRATPAGKKINIHIEKTGATQQQALEALHSFATQENITLSPTTISTLKNDPLIQRMLNMPGETASLTRMFALRVAEDDLSGAKNIFYGTEKIEFKNFQALEEKYTDLILRKGEISDLHPFAEKGNPRALQQIFTKGSFQDIFPYAQNGNNQALQAAFDKTENQTQYCKAERILIDKIKDKLFKFSAHIGQGSASSKVWNESRLFGRTTDEGSSTGTQQVSYRAEVNQALFSPRCEYIIKANLVTTLTYTGSTSGERDVVTTLQARLGGNSLNASGNTHVSWLYRRVGAGSFMTQDYVANNIRYEIKNISVE
ncbi:MAG: hypothetical protein Q4B94_05080 [Pseudomonadota bacterium]|nr:hypothetical protein [Pseudomonadota bacterium]